MCIRDRSIGADISTLRLCNDALYLANLCLRGCLLFILPHTIAEASAAIRGHRSAASLATGPFIPLPFVSPC